MRQAPYLGDDSGFWPLIGIILAALVILALLLHWAS
jgi:hypothetical protein